MTTKPLWQRAVSYGAVGATQREDLLHYPPAGYRPFERRTRIGHGDARWQHAWQSTLSWGIQTSSGFGVEPAESPPEVTEGTYVPALFDEAGNPVPQEPLPESDEAVFGPYGLPFIAAGDTATLIVPLGPFSFRAPCRVIYVVDEPHRKGFAYGTIAGHPERGEEAFIVERTEDGSVWLTIRSFSRPANWFWWLGYPVLRVTQGVYTRRYFRALTGPIG